MAFAADVTRFVQKTKLKPDKVLRKVAFDAYAELLKMSPVDTSRFRGQWRISVNSVDVTVDERLAGCPSGSPPTAEEKIRALAVLKTAKFGDTVHITNNLDYAEHLEGGHSTQAPAGVLNVVYIRMVLNLEAMVRKAAE